MVVESEEKYDNMGSKMPKMCKIDKFVSNVLFALNNQEALIISCFSFDTMIEGGAGQMLRNANEGGHANANESGRGASQLLTLFDKC